MNYAKSVLRYMLFPGWLMLVAFIALLGFRSGISPGLVIVGTGAATFFLVSFFERVMTYQAHWNQSRKEISTDLISFGVLAALVDPALKIGSAAFAVWTASAIAPYSLHIFPTDLPLIVQVTLVFLTAEFGKYWAHRWHHENAMLWELHAMHHSVERLYTLNNFRIHPFNQALSYVMSMLPLAVIGVPIEPLLVYAAVATAVSFFQHANIDLRFGILNYVFSTNQLHRWHHSVKLPEGNRNYGSVLIVWDLLFKTHYLPKHTPHPTAIGISDAAYPKRGYFKQLLWPYCVRYCHA